MLSDYHYIYCNLKAVEDTEYTPFDRNKAQQIMNEMKHRISTLSGVGLFTLINVFYILGWVLPGIMKRQSLLLIDFVGIGLMFLSLIVFIDKLSKNDEYQIDLLPVDFHEDFTLVLQDELNNVQNKLAIIILGTIFKIHLSIENIEAGGLLRDITIPSKYYTMARGAQESIFNEKSFRIRARSNSIQSFFFMQQIMPELAIIKQNIDRFPNFLDTNQRHLIDTFKIINPIHLPIPIIRLIECAFDRSHNFGIYLSPFEFGKLSVRCIRCHLIYFSNRPRASLFVGIEGCYGYIEPLTGFKKELHYCQVRLDSQVEMVILNDAPIVTPPGISCTFFRWELYGRFQDSFKGLVSQLNDKFKDKKHFPVDYLKSISREEQTAYSILKISAPVIPDLSLW